jgi:hypothetical protein
MRRTHTIRRFSVVALVVGASVGSVTISDAAWATSGGTVTCITATGTQESPASLFSCTDSSNSDATGGAGTIQVNPPKPAFPVFVGTRVGTIYWSGATMSKAAATVIRVRTQVVKKKNTPCLSNTELKVNGRVRSDTSGVVTVGGTVSAVLCRAANGTYSLLQNTTFVIGG